MIVNRTRINQIVLKILPRRSSNAISKVLQVLLQQRLTPNNVLNSRRKNTRHNGIENYSKTAFVVIIIIISGQEFFQLNIFSTNLGEHYLLT